MAYGQEIKDKASALLVEGKSHTEISQELGVAYNTIRYWLKPGWRERQQALSKDWAGKNRDRANENTRKWAEAHPEYAHEYYAENRETYLENSKRWGEKNKELIRERSKVYTKTRRDRARKRNKPYVSQYLESHHCAVCGESDPLILCFHHRDPETKDGDISDMIDRRSLQSLQEEIAKCDVLCRNCHRIFHNEEHSEYPRTAKAQEIRGIKSVNGCVICGEKHPAALSFHHKRPETKKAAISSMAGKPRREIAEEIAKCAILCANCHVKVHAGVLSLDDVSIPQYEFSLIDDYRHKRGVDVKGARLNEDKVREIRILLEQGMTQIKVAQLYGVGETTIWNINKGKTWAHVH